MSGDDVVVALGGDGDDDSEDESHGNADDNDDDVESGEDDGDSDSADNGDQAQGGNVMWAWYSQCGWAYYLEDLQLLIERAFRNDANGSVTFVSGYTTVSLDFAASTQTDLNRNQTHPIRRDTSLPPNCWFWFAMGSLIRYNEEASALLDAAAVMGEAAVWRDYVLCCQSYEQTNINTGTSRPIIRVDTDNLMAKFNSQPSDALLQAATRAVNHQPPVILGRGHARCLGGDAAVSRLRLKKFFQIVVEPCKARRLATPTNSDSRGPSSSSLLGETPAADRTEKSNSSPSVGGEANDSCTGSNNTAGADKRDEDGEDDCPICLDTLSVAKGDVAKLRGCGHLFHDSCFMEFAKKSENQGDLACPMCKGKMSDGRGPSPAATMSWLIYGRQSPPGPYTISGYEDSGLIRIHYEIPGGVQRACHQNPGQRFPPDRRVAYLPDNAEGRKVLLLLRKSFQRGLTFTVGTSLTRGTHNVVCWNGVHHKSRVDGGVAAHGYPDAGYLLRVQDELSSRHVKLTETEIDSEFVKLVTHTPPRPEDNEDDNDEDDGE